MVPRLATGACAGGRALRGRRTATIPRTAAPAGAAITPRRAAALAPRSGRRAHRGRRARSNEYALAAPLAPPPVPVPGVGAGYHPF